MAQDLFQYDKMVEAALRGVVRTALARAASDGLRGGHHFYVAFLTGAPGVDIPETLRTQYPDEMTIVLQHQFRDLEIGDDSFAVTLSFNSRAERLTIPFAAISSFADPSVEFGLRFAAPPQADAALPAPAPAAAKPDEPPGGAAAKVVTLDAFRKR